MENVYSSSDSLLHELDTQNPSESLLTLQNFIESREESIFRIPDFPAGRASSSLMLYFVGTLDG